MADLVRRFRGAGRVPHGVGQSRCSSSNNRTPRTVCSQPVAKKATKKKVRYAIYSSASRVLMHEGRRAEREKCAYMPLMDLVKCGKGCRTETSISGKSVKQRSSHLPGHLLSDTDGEVVRHAANFKAQAFVAMGRPSACSSGVWARASVMKSSQRLSAMMAGQPTSIARQKSQRRTDGILVCRRSGGGGGGER